MYNSVCMHRNHKCMCTVTYVWNEYITHDSTRLTFPQLLQQQPIGVLLQHKAHVYGRTTLKTTFPCSSKMSILNGRALPRQCRAHPPVWSAAKKIRGGWLSIWRKIAYLLFISEPFSTDGKEEQIWSKLVELYLLSKILWTNNKYLLTSLSTCHRYIEHMNEYELDLPSRISICCWMNKLSTVARLSNPGVFVWTPTVCGWIAVTEKSPFLIA